VARLACLLAAGALIARQGGEEPAPPRAAPRPARPELRLDEVPRLWRSKRRERRV